MVGRLSPLRDLGGVASVLSHPARRRWIWYPKRIRSSCYPLGDMLGPSGSLCVRVWNSKAPALGVFARAKGVRVKRTKFSNDDVARRVRWNYRGGPAEGVPMERAPSGRLGSFCLVDDLSILIPQGERFRRLFGRDTCFPMEQVGKTLVRVGSGPGYGAGICSGGPRDLLFREAIYERSCNSARVRAFIQVPTSGAGKQIEAKSKRKKSEDQIV